MSRTLSALLLATSILTAVLFAAAPNDENQPGESNMQGSQDLAAVLADDGPIAQGDSGLVVLEQRIQRCSPSWMRSPPASPRDSALARRSGCRHRQRRC